MRRRIIVPEKEGREIGPSHSDRPPQPISGLKFLLAGPLLVLIRLPKNQLLLPRPADADSGDLDSMLRCASMRRTISEGWMFNTAASLTNTRIVGLLTPRSIRLTYVRSKPASRASFSCDSLRSRLTSRRACPNAFSEPERGWICFAFACFRRCCANRTMLLR